MVQLTYGTTVRLKQGASPIERVGSPAEIVGIFEVDTIAKARDYSATIGTTIYSIEFGDGHTIEVPESWVETVTA